MVVHVCRLYHFAFLVQFYIAFVPIMYMVFSYYFSAVISSSLANKEHVGTRIFVLYGEVSFIWRLKFGRVIFSFIKWCPLSEVPLYTVNSS